MGTAVAAMVGQTILYPSRASPTRDTMNTAPQNLTPADILKICRTHWRLCLIPAVAGAFLAGAYSIIAPRTWSSTQTLIVRPEAASMSVDQRLGKFSDLSEMKTLQETILELAHSQSVVLATLQQVGPSANYRKPELWPTPRDVEDFRKHVKITPPHGAEFGKTEVFYLSVLDSDRDRASRLVAVLCDQLEGRMQELRDQRAQSMMAELGKTVAMAQDDLNSETVHLAKFESSVGADLAELRNLVTDVGATSNAAQELQVIEAERRAVAAQIRENEKLLAVLRTAEVSPDRSIMTPQTLLKSQPAIHRLKDALVDAQVRTAELVATLQEDHPFVSGSKASEAKIRDDLHQELSLAIQGIELDLSVDKDRAVSLREQAESGRDRLSQLAELRAGYANLVASVGNYTQLLEAARKNLSDARAHQASAQSVSLISRIDGVEAGVQPEGPSRKIITASGGLAGLLLGFGLVLLSVQPSLPVGGRDLVPIHNNESLAMNGHEFSYDDQPVVDPIESVYPAVFARRQSSFAPRQISSPVRSFRGMTLTQAIESIQIGQG
jgi:uncharacterized protein involved in exopolysaccharide biosynthesis